VIQVKGTVEQTKVYSEDAMLAQGNGTIFKGAPDLGVKAGPETSPQLDAAVNQ
jgi:hypothetical protein